MIQMPFKLCCFSLYPRVGDLHLDSSEISLLTADCCIRGIISMDSESLSFPRISLQSFYTWQLFNLLSSLQEELLYTQVQIWCAYGRRWAQSLPMLPYWTHPLHPSYKDPCNYIKLTQNILAVPRSLTQALKQALPYKITYSRLQGLRHGHCQETIILCSILMLLSPPEISSITFF